MITSNNQIFSGLFTALVTPTNQDQTVNYKMLSQLLYYGADTVNGYVILGSTGDPAARNAKDKETIIMMATGICHDMGKKVIMGASSEDIELIKAGYELGAKYHVDGMLTMPLLGTKQLPDGLKNMFRTLSDYGIPIIIYNNKGRTGQNNITKKDMEGLSQIENVVAIKEASGDPEQIEDIIKASGEMGIKVLSGDDNMTARMMGQFKDQGFGAHGAISVLSNLLPGQISTIADSNNYDFPEFNPRLYDEKLKPFYKAITAAGNPPSIKFIMEHFGIPVGGCSPCMGKVSDAKAAEIIGLLNQYRELPSLKEEVQINWQRACER